MRNAPRYTVPSAQHPVVNLVIQYTKKKNTKEWQNEGYVHKYETELVFQVK